MRVLWVHNFDRGKNKNSGVFMYDQLNELRNNGLEIDLHCINGKSVFQTLSDFLHIRRKSKQYDLVHAQYGSFVGFFSSFLPQKKIVSLRGTDYYGVPKVSLKTKIHNRLSLFFTFNSLKRFDAIITMSDRMTNELKAKYRDKKIVTITDGMLLNGFKKEHISKQENQPFKILFSSINKDNPIKRAYLGIEAVRILKERKFNVELVPMTGVDREEVPAFIGKCDMVLLTSTHEGWPNIIKECLALDIPFVSTDVSDLKAIAKLESNCFIVEPDAEKIAEAIIQVIKADKTRHNLRKYVEPMDMGNYAKRLINTYQST